MPSLYPASALVDGHVAADYILRKQRIFISPMFAVVRLIEAKQRLGEMGMADFETYDITSIIVGMPDSIPLPWTSLASALR